MKKHTKDQYELREDLHLLAGRLSHTPNKTPMDEHERFKIKFAIWMIIEEIGNLAMQETEVKEERMPGLIEVIERDFVLVGDIYKLKT